MKFTETQFDKFPAGTQMAYTTATGVTGTVIRSAPEGGASSGGIQIAGGKHWRQIATWPDTEFNVQFIPGVTAAPTADDIAAIIGN